MEEEEIQNEEENNQEHDDDVPEEGEFKEEDFEKLVTVFKTSDQGIAAVAKSILDEAGIQYYVKGEGAQSLFGVGVIGVGGFSTEANPVEIQVIQEDEEKAKDLLKDVESSKPVDNSGDILKETDTDEDI